MRMLWIRWLVRDLRRRWVLVAAIAAVIALGTGTYAALIGTSTWRRESNDASFARLHLHDVKARLAEGTFTPEGSLLKAVRAIPHADQIEAAEERLVVPTQVDTAPAGGTALVPGELVGAATRSPRNAGAVDAVHIAEGSAPRPTDPATTTAVLEYKFARAHDLPASGRVRLSGGEEIRYSGQGYGPEQFVVSGRGAASLLVESGFATVYVPLPGAQTLTGLRGQVNDVVVTLRPGADTALVRAEVDAALEGAAPPVSATVTTNTDEPSHRILYQDIEGDERFWTIIAGLMLAGATFAAVNLTARVVEGERREIGIGMALGVRPAALALRPLMLGVEIAIAGVLLGLGLGYLLIVPLRGLFTSALPLPEWHTPLVAGPFLRAAAIGVVLPLAAVAWPVWRAVRVQPVQAIRVGHLAGRGTGAARLLRVLPLPGRSYWHMPVRNLLRAPRRTSLTALGIATAVAVVVTVGGLLDSVNETIGRADTESTRTAPDRLTVSLDTYRPVDDPALRAIAGQPGVKRVSSGLVVPGKAVTGKDSIDVSVRVLDPKDAPWTPRITSGTPTGGLVLTRTAADDLGIGVGDTVTLRHPRWEGGAARVAKSPVRVAGLYDYPLRAVAYLDAGSAAFLGGAGTTNVLDVVPERGTDRDALRRALMSVPSVVSVTSPQDLADQFHDATEQLLSVLAVVAAVTALLALLIAFNTASITADERRRENATMMAYGLPVRTVIGMATLESTLMGLLGTLMGLGLGVAFTGWIVGVEMPRTLPDFGIVTHLGAGTVLEALALGVAAAAIAQLLMTRRLRRMDLPSTLRVVE